MKTAQNNCLYGYKEKWGQNFFNSPLIAISLCFLFVVNSSSYVYAEEFSNDPMETKIQAAPANIMFVLDNSGSMDWEFMTPENDGEFHDERYVFDISDNQYSDILTGSKLLEWKSQWAGYNKIYYNPATTYHPWPRWEEMDSTKAADGTTISAGGTLPPHEADIKEPRSNPVGNTPTLSILDTFYANVPVNNFTIVDDDDGSPAFTSTGSWNESIMTPEWNGYSKYTSTDGDRVVFTPDIPETDAYNIYAWWNCFDDRDRNALVEIDADDDGVIDASERKDQRSTSNNIPETGVCGEWLPLFGGVSFVFSQGHHGTVTIIRDSPDGSSTVADAIAFVVAGTIMTESAVDIKNAHYYMVNDIDNDGEAEAGEVYLVNFIWNDADSDSEVDDGEISRNYYLVSFSSSTSNHEVVQYLLPVNSDVADQGNDDIPDTIQPVKTNEDGSKSYLTDMEDLQNFVNWFSFYRRRELTAKAAIARTIDDLEWVNVGYYTLHSTGGARQTVLPVKVDATNEVIVDNQDSGFTKSSSWYESGSQPEYNGSSVYTGSSGKWAKWTPNISATGMFEVFAWWNCYYNRDQKAKFTISHAGGTTVKYLNQRASSNHTVTTKNDCEDASGSGCCGYWVSLGSYTFNQGNTGYVQVERHASSTGSSTDADAVKFVGGGSVNVDETDTLLDTLYSIDSNGGTPLRQSLRDVGRYFDQDDGYTGNLGTSPYESEADGGACQQAFAIAMTDGYWNGSSPGVGHQDQGEGAPYQDNVADTLADVAWKFYDADLADSLPNDMPTNNYDKNKTQHMVTFSVSFGLSGLIDTNDIDDDGSVDDPGYVDDPYFLNPDTPTPIWPDPTNSCYSCPKKIDDLWHASVNGRGRFFQADDPDTLVSSLKELFKDISSRTASGASVSVNGDELSTGLVLYQSSYTAGLWTGNVTAYPIDPVSGEVKKQEDDILWQAREQLQNQDWQYGRRIITSDLNGSGIAFRYSAAGLSTTQKDCLDNNADVVRYLRGKEITGFRSRTKKLGDIVHSAPLLVNSTIYTGGNDGMLHAFNADTGEERFAYVPLHVFSYLYDLTKTDYSHRFYVDATPYAKELVFFAGDFTDDGLDNDGDGVIDEADEDYSDSVDNDGDGSTDEKFEKKQMTLLVGALKKGGRGIYALDISSADTVDENTTEASLVNMVKWEYPPAPAGMIFEYAGDQTSDGVDNDGDGVTDEADEDYSDGYDNDGDGDTDEEGEKWLNFGDDDMGYTFSDPFIVRSYKSFNEASSSDHPWVVIFGNGYESRNGHAVLYIVDALDGTLIRKIDTGVGGNNGLSTPAIVDVDNDDRADYVYAGDLLGNMWKFDITAHDPDNWGVAYGTDIGNPTGKQRIDYVDTDGGIPANHDDPRPLFSAAGQPITSTPDVMYHCEYEKNGFMIIFGTGKFLGEDDRSDTSQQTIFGIWDFANMVDADSDGRDNDHDGVIDEGTDGLDNDSDGHVDEDDEGEEKLDSGAYLGSWSRATNTIDNLNGVELLEQAEIDWRYLNGSYLRTLSDYSPQWYLQCADGVDNDGDGYIDDEDDGNDGHGTPEKCVPVSPSAYFSDGEDNDGDGDVDETGENIGHAGWFFDLPYMVDASSDGIDNDGDGDTDEAGEEKRAGERVIKDVLIRDGRAIVITFIPEDSPCTGGGYSIIHEMDACDGSRLSSPVFDINNDGVIDDRDLIPIIDEFGNTIYVPPTGKMFDGILHTPVIVGDPDETRNREMKIFSSSAGTTEVVWEKKEKVGFYYWREH